VQPDADARCIAAVLAGERERFEELVVRYQDAVTTVVRGYIRNPHAAEDAAQDALVTAFSALPQLRDPKLFFPWLLQIARHRAAQMAQRGERQQEHVPLTGEEPGKEAPAAAQERTASVLSCVEELPEPYRQTLLLKYERDLSCKQIAAIEHVPIGTVTSRLTRALVMLRGSLSRAGIK
jgi:RNA polymerase sigma-70 factor (ECF subfamily)